jgi:chromosome segregation ATPase
VLVTTAEEMGRINREIRQLEDQVDIEKKKEMAKKLEEIQKDYDAIKEENLAIDEQIKKLKAQGK